MIGKLVDWHNFPGELMTPAALGFRMHSGWGVLVAVAGDAKSIEILDRSSIVIIDPKTGGAKQPYHHAVNLSLAEAEKHLAKCAAASERLTSTAIVEVIGKLQERNYRVVGAAVLLASGRTLPPLEKILAAHPLIHTAEGEFFRGAVRKACESLKIPVTAIRERDLDEQAKAQFGNAAARVQRDIAGMSSTIGPPWTKDHKAAALAALMMLTSVKPQISRAAGR